MAQVEVNLTDGQKLQTITSPDCSYVDIDDDYVYMKSPYKNKKLGKKNKNNKKNMKLDSIMKKQIGEKEFIPSDQIINEYFVDEDLPQDVLIESLLVSQMQQQQQPTVTNDTNINNENTNSKPSEEISSENNNNNNIENVVKTSNVSNVNNDQYLADLLLAMDLQQAEEENFKQRRAHEELYNGKYTKVRETAPKLTTNDVTFYYDMDEFVNNNNTNTNNNNTNLTVSSNNNDSNNNSDLKSKRKRRRKNKKIENNENNENENVEENNNNNSQTSPDKKPITTKHDPIVWNQKHCQRLKAYEAMGDVNANEMHISNKAFNAIRYRLERKGFTKDPPEMNM